MSIQVLNYPRKVRTEKERIAAVIAATPSTLNLPFIYITLEQFTANPTIIQDSLTSLTSGGVVELSEGSFHLLNVLTIPTGVWLKGAGQLVTYLWYNTNVNLDIITILASYCTVSDLSVRGCDPASQYGNGFGSIGTGRGIVIAVPTGSYGSQSPVYFPAIRNVEVANTPSWCIYDSGFRNLKNLGTGVSPDINYELPTGATTDPDHGQYNALALSVGLTIDNVQLGFPNSGGALYIGYGCTAFRVSGLLTNSYSFNTITIAGITEDLGAVQLYNVADGTFDHKCVFQSPSAQGGGVTVTHADTDATFISMVLATTIHFEAPYFEVLSLHCAGGPGRTHWWVSTINSNWVMEQPYGISNVYSLATGLGYPLRLVHSPQGETIGSGVTMRDGNFYHYRETYATGTQPRYLASGSPSVLDRDDILLEGSLESGADISDCRVINYTTGVSRDPTTPASPDSGYLVPQRAGSSFSNANGSIQLARFDDCNLATAVHPSDLRARWSLYHVYAGGVLGYVKGFGHHDVYANLNGTVNVVANVAGQFDAVEVGNAVTGTHLPAGTYVTAKASDSAITVSAAATATISEVLTFYNNGTFQREGLWVCSNRSGPDFRQIPYMRIHPSIWSGVEPGDLWMLLGSPVGSVYTTAEFRWYDGTAWQTQINRSIGTAAGDLIKYTASDTPARLAIGAQGQFLGTAAGTLPTWSNPILQTDLLKITDDVGVRTLKLDVTPITVAQTRTLSVQDLTAAVVPVGNVTGTTATAGTLGRSIMSARTGNVTAQTLLTGGSTPDGLYRVSFYLKTTTAGTPGVAQVKVTVSWNDGTAQTLDVPFLNGTVIFNNLDLGTLNAFAQGDIIVYSVTGAGKDISFTTTGTYTGSPQYLLEARIESLG